MVGDLRGSDVEAADESDGHAEDGGRAQEWIDADEQADGEAPGEALRACSHAEQR